MDNTAYIKEFEKTRFQCFTRAPRWGKSLLTQILSTYYDKATTSEQWDTLFGGLNIHKNPTKLRGHFQVLNLDFSEGAQAAGSVEDMNALLTEHINFMCLKFGGKYGYNISTDKIEVATDPELIYHHENNAMFTLETLGTAVHARGEELYLIVDEYDRYANVCLLDREDVDQDGYRKAVMDRPINQFFSTLKSLEAEGCLSCLFITGLLRLAISDGFAANNILLTSAERAVGPALGFPLKEIERVVRELELGAAGEERQRFEAEALALIKTYCNGYRFPGVDDDGLYCPQLCLSVFYHLCDEKSWVYLDEKEDRFWRKVAPQEIMARLGDENSAPSGAAVRLLARLPEARKELRCLSKGPVEFQESVLGRRDTFSSLLAAGKASRLNRLLTATGSASERREAALSFMYDQGLVTCGPRQDSLVFPNDVARLVVNETIYLPQSKKVIMRKWRNRAAVATKHVWDSIIRKLRRSSDK